MKKVKLPNIKTLTGNGAEGVIVNFFRELGWDGEATLNPSRVHLNRDDAVSLAEKCKEIQGNDELALMVYLNWGPASDRNIPKGVVMVEDGWIGNQEMI